MIWIWLGFIAFIMAMLALDLGVFHRKAHVVTVREALKWSAVWMSLSLTFSVLVYFGYENHWMGLGSVVDAADGHVNDGRTAAVKYLTGYIVEQSLSVDNIFVIAMILGFMKVPPAHQHRVLFWGVLGAVAMRGLMIGLGAALIANFHWILYLFGVFLLVTGAKMLITKAEEEMDPARHPVLRLIRKLVPITANFHGERFVVRAGITPVSPDPAISATPHGTLMLTPLAIALILVETADLVFAVDSIPAIFAITVDPFLVFTSNIFAILGLRSLYFALAGLLDMFKYLKVSLSLVLMLIGLKMLFARQLKDMLGANFNFYLLATILTILLGGVAVSLYEERMARRGTRRV